MDTIGQRIKYLREKRGLSQVELAGKLSVSQQAIQQVESGKARKPKYLYEVATLLQTSYEWLAFGEDNPNYAEPSIDIKKQAHNNNVQQSITGSADNQIKMMELALSADSNYPFFTKEVSDTALRPRILDGVEKAYGVFVYDEYMSPRYVTGEAIFMHPGKPLKDGDFAFVVTNDNLAMILQLDHKDEDLFVFTRLNPYKMIRLNKSDIQFAHKIIASQ